jgi:hypothetical protein
VQVKEESKEGDWAECCVDRNNLVSIIGAPYYITLICFEPEGLYIGGRTKCRKWMSPEMLCTVL